MDKKKPNKNLGTATQNTASTGAIGCVTDETTKDKCFNDPGWQQVRDDLETLLAIETLEYHNVNWLAYSTKPAIRSREKRALIERILRPFPKSARCLQT